MESRDRRWRHESHVERGLGRWGGVPRPATKRNPLTRWLDDRCRRTRRGVQQRCLGDEVHGDEVHVTPTVGGLTVLPLQRSSAAGKPEALLPHHGVRAMPNPTTGGCGLIFQPPAASATRMKVHDAAGRIVMQLAEQPLAAGVGELDGDGRGAGGEALPSVVCFARLRGAGIDAAKRVMLRRWARGDTALDRSWRAGIGGAGCPVALNAPSSLRPVQTPCIRRADHAPRLPR